MSDEFQAEAHVVTSFIKAIPKSITIFPFVNMMLSELKQAITVCANMVLLESWHYGLNYRQRILIWIGVLNWHFKDCSWNE